MITKRILLIATLAAALTPFSHAADAERKTRRPDSAQGAIGQRMTGNLEELGLNEDQKSKIQEYLRENGEKMRTLREDQSTSREEKAKKFQEFQTASTAKMKEVLTKEQFEKWEKTRAAGTGGSLAGGREGMQKILDDLNLNEDQKEKAKAAMQEQGQAMQGLRQASPEERREKMGKAQEAMTAKMKEILTKEQFEKWEKARPQLGVRPSAGDAPRKKKRE